MFEMPRVEWGKQQLVVMPACLSLSKGQMRDN